MTYSPFGLGIATLGTSQASKFVTVDSSGDLIIPDGDKFEFGAGSDMTLYHDATDSFITNKTGALNIATLTSGIAISIGLPWYILRHGTSYDNPCIQVSHEGRWASFPSRF